jgi:hypothetical protein
MTIDFTTPPLTPKVRFRTGVELDSNFAQVAVMDRRRAIDVTA